MCVVGAEAASLAVVVEALRGAGFEPAVGTDPGHGAACRCLPTAWIGVPGGAYVVVAVADVLPDQRESGRWRAAHGATAAAVVSGYQVSFHEPSRTAGRTVAVSHAYAVFVDDVVAAVRQWADWESTWSVTPAAEAPGRRLVRLRRLAAGRIASSTVPVDIDVDPLMVALLDTAQADRLHQLLDRLFLPGMRWRFPRDTNGVRFATRAQVLLHECAPASHPAGKGVWLVVDGPPPRAEQRLTVRLAHAVGKAAPHRWDGWPEYWHTGPRTLDQLWGIDGDITATFVDAVVDHLLAGRSLDALTMCEVATDRSTGRLLAGLPDRFELRTWTDTWVTNATTALGTAAPWQWVHKVSPRRRPQRLASLGGFNPNRRPGLFLDHHDGRPRLSFDCVASVLVMPRVCWQRDTDYDLVRHGLITRDQIPMPPR